MDKTYNWIEKARKVHGDRYDYSKVEYVNAKTKVCIVCPEHGEFWQSPNNHLNGSGCPECKKERLRELRTRDSSEFIAKAREVHGDRYDYSKVEYVNSQTKVCIVCPEHGEFWQEANTHLQGHGCPRCMNVSRSSTDEFIAKAREVHGDRYDYSKVEYVNNKTKVCIICPEHGEFWQTPKHHLKGQGCMRCKYVRDSRNLVMTTEEFIAKACEVHGDKYDYSKVEYEGNRKPVDIVCSKHGVFKQMPHEHLKGCGCPICGYTVSNGENEIVEFIRSNFNVEIIQRSRNIISPYELDIYVPSMKLAIEFDGILFHSEAYNKDKYYHLNKTRRCEECGIRLIHIFEDEWRDNKELVMSMLSNLFGKNSIRIYARKCQIKPVEHAVAKAFLNRNHLQGECKCPVSYGLYYGDRLVSLMVFGKTRQQAKYNENYDTTYEILRFCSERGVNVIGGASKLLNHFIDEYHPYEIITYADKRWSIGKLYEMIGFDYVHDSKPNYFYVVNKKRENRFKYRKGELVKQGYDIDKSEHEIMLERKIYRIYDCGTKVYSMRPNYL